ncbi:hypothetical protein SMICM304S_07917 [Streptomyces microflavus]
MPGRTARPARQGIGGRSARGVRAERQRPLLAVARPARRVPPSARPGPDRSTSGEHQAHPVPDTVSDETTGEEAVRRLRGARPAPCPALPRPGRRGPRPARAPGLAPPSAAPRVAPPPGAGGRHPPGGRGRPRRPAAARGAHPPRPGNHPPARGHAGGGRSPRRRPAPKPQPRRTAAAGGGAQRPGGGGLPRPPRRPRGYPELGTRDQRRDQAPAPTPVAATTMPGPMYFQLDLRAGAGSPASGLRLSPPCRSRKRNRQGGARGRRGFGGWGGPG